MATKKANNILRDSYKLATPFYKQLPKDSLLNNHGFITHPHIDGYFCRS